MEKVKILDVFVSVTTYNEIIFDIKNAIKNNKKYLIMAINPKKIMLARENKQLKQALDNSTCSIPDGYQIVKSCDKIKSRITGIDLMQKICKEHKKVGAKIFLYGASSESVKLAKQKLKEKYSGIKIVDYIDGYQKDDIVIDKINKSKANIVFVALGSPKQEIWINEHKNEITANIIMGVGGSFDVISGNVKRAPVLFQKLGLEWLYRFIKQPKRMREIPLYINYLKLVRKEVKK